MENDPVCVLMEWLLEIAESEEMNLHNTESVRTTIMRVIVDKGWYEIIAIVCIHIFIQDSLHWNHSSPLTNNSNIEIASEYSNEDSPS